ncbi:MAG TPA: transposase [Ktedonobacteraceae bacterium]|nr:transposase [Ktedonobacteraceae bacterium]
MSDQANRKRYPSDISDEQWEILSLFLPKPPADSPREPIPQREIVNGILYVLRTGCSWRQMPHDLPNGKTVYYSFRKWKLDGTWERVMTALRKHVRAQAGRQPEPSAAVIDSQSIKTSPVRGQERGFDGGKKNLGPQAAPVGGYARESACREGSFGGFGG